MTTSLPKILQSEATVRFQHCDPLGHLNNSMYIDYLLNAREDQLSHHYGLDIYNHARETGKAWVVASHQLQYKQPVSAMQKVTIVSSLKGYNDKSLNVYFEMKVADQLCCTMETSFVYIDVKSGRPVDHGEALISLFEQIRLP